MTAPGRPSPATLFTPRRVAVIGASAGSGDPWSFNARLTRAVLGSCLDDVVLVSRSTPEIAGHATVRSVDAVEGPVDVAVVAVPGAAVADTVDACAAAGVVGCIVISSGVPDDGRARIRARCAESGLRVLGPNCVGFVDAAAGVSLFAGGTPPSRAGTGPEVAVITQSGGFASSVIAAGEPAGLRFGHVFSTGDELDVGLEDCLAHVLDAGRSATVVCFVEAVRDPARFRILARRAAREGVPLLVLRIGRTAVARTVALAHSGALVDDWAATEAALESDGVITCRSLQEVLDTAVVVVAARGPVGPDLDVVSSSGALGALAADLATDHGLVLRPAADCLGARVVAARGGGPVDLANPLDTATTGGSVATVAALTDAVRADGAAVGSALLFGHSGATYADAVGDALAGFAAAARTAAPDRGVVIACWPGVPAPVAEALRTAGVADVPDPDRALGALGRYARWSGIAPTIPSDAASVEGHEDHAARGPGGLVGYAASRAVVAGWGLPAPAHVVVAEGDDPVAAVAGLRAPYAVKVAEGANHKAAAGGVVLGVTDATAVADVVAGLRRAGHTGALVVEEMVAPGVEVLVDVRRSAFGDLLTIGWGGSATEEIADVATVAAPWSAGRVDAALARTRVGRRLARVVPTAARDALVTFCRTLTDRVAASPDVWEVEINPVIVNPEGAFAADARVVASVVTEEAP